MPVPFDAANKQYTAPGCEPLPAHYDGTHVVTCWSLTDRQIEELVETKRLWMGVMGSAPQPVWLTTDYPFTDQSAWPDLLGGDDEV